MDYESPECEPALRELDSELSDLPDHNRLPAWLSAPLDEFFRSLDAAAKLVGAYAPSELSTLEALAREISELVAELVFLYEPTGPTPEGLTNFPEESLRAKSNTRDKLVHQRVSRVIQLNSALSYLTSQGFAGSFPILEHECLVRRFSLLGIGNSVRGVTSLVRCMESVFETYPVDAVIRDHSSKRQRIEDYAFRSAYDPSSWSKHSPDAYFSEVDPDHLVPKIVYFSGRLGFRASERTLATAVHTLVDGAAFHWTLMTLTHEVLHSHVRDILAYILSPKEGESPEESLNRFHEEFQAAHRASPVEETQLTSIRNIILTYVCQSRVLGSITRPRPGSSKRSLTAKATALPKEDLIRGLADEYRNINEILVHSLDYLYCFRGRREFYVQYLWHSWSPVPAVLDDVRQYVLRTLLAISADHQPEIRSDVMRRFKEASAVFRSALEELKSDEMWKPMFDDALRVLDQRDVLLAYVGAVQLVDLARYVFYSREVISSLYDDPLAKLGGDRVLEYTLEPRTFEEWIVKSPAALVVDMLRRGRAQKMGEVDGQSVEAETAWMYLALASAEPQLGDTE